MLKAKSLVVFGLIAFAGQAAWGQETPISYYGFGNTGVVITEVVPPGGFVLTDILKEGNSGAIVTVTEDNGESTSTKLVTFLGNGGNGDHTTLHMRTGIPFAGGATLRLSHTVASSLGYTISGYIPKTMVDPNVPAVGTWGLCVMVLMIVTGGTMVLRQRRSMA